jgi:hypothetical protein
VTFDSLHHNRSYFRESDTAFILQHSRCVLLLTSRLESVTKCKLDGFLTHLESYCWTFIGHSVDSVRHNVRNTLAKIVGLLEPDQLLSLRGRLNAMSWGAKGKLLGLLAVAKVVGAEPLLKQGRDRSNLNRTVVRSRQILLNFADYATLASTACPAQCLTWRVNSLQSRQNVYIYSCNMRLYKNMRINTKKNQCKICHIFHEANYTEKNVIFHSARAACVGERLSRW